MAEKEKKVTLWTRIYAWPVAIVLGLVAWRWRKAGLMGSVSLKNRIRREYLDMVDPWSSAQQERAASDDSPKEQESV